MADNTFKTIPANELTQDEAPQLIALVYSSEIGQSVLSTAGIESVEVEGGVSGVVVALLLAFVAVVTISRRPQAAD